MSTRKVHGFFQDEQGDHSLARVSFFATLAFTLVVIVADIRWYEVPEVVYGLLEAVVVALAAWAGAPRAMRYLRSQKAPASLRVPEDA